jgi:imidazolonepropionase
MRAAGLRIALATDLNPGSSPALSLLLMLNMGCTLFRLTVAEALRGVTVNAAAALGLADRGTLAPGQRCDLALFAISRPAELCYWIGRNPCVSRVVAGA